MYLVQKIISLQVTFVDTGTYVNHLYKNILGRDADQGGYDNWVEQLDSGNKNRGELLLVFAESLDDKALFTEETGLFMVGNKYFRVVLIF